MSNAFDINDNTDPDVQEAHRLMAEGYAARVRGWQDQAVAKHPEIAHLRDLLTGDSAEAVESLASDIAERQRNAGQAERPVHVPAGSPSLDPADFEPSHGDAESQRLIAQMRAQPYSRDPATGRSRMALLLERKLSQMGE